ncbi:T9SS type A sorting domain-containing protein [candidate division KSB1 bacterium]|nr:T9SS type A sorting domain-containing protein [candidate division KSB1 bacterium]
MIRFIDFSGMRSGISIVSNLLFWFSIAAPSVFAQSAIYPPEESPFFFQTNGPFVSIDQGDWWSNAGRNGGNQPHLFEITVPHLVPDTFQIALELYDPECNHTGTDFDKIGGWDWDTTEFWLAGPIQHQLITRQRFVPPDTTSERWVPFVSFTSSQYGYGVYRLYTSTEVDDQNMFRLKIVDSDPDNRPNSGDEITLLPVKTAFTSSEASCQTLWFYVAGDETLLELYNFDMDRRESIDYISPSGEVFKGTVSGYGSWNNSPFAYFPHSGGDWLQHPEPGWWRTDMCIDASNQFVFYAERGLFLQAPLPEPRLTVEKLHSPDVIRPYVPFEYRYRVANIGEVPAQEVALVDTLPAATEFILASESGVFTSGVRATTVDWYLPVLAPGEQQEFSVRLLVTDLEQTTFDNTIRLTFHDAAYNFHVGPLLTDHTPLEPVALVQGRVWLDDNTDGLYNEPEQGLKDIEVYLHNLANGNERMQQTDAEGEFLFVDLEPANHSLWLDETRLPAGYRLTTNNNPTHFYISEAEIVQIEGFGLSPEAMAIELASFSVEQVGNGAEVRWETHSETKNLGFHVFRSETTDGRYEQINDQLIEGAGNSSSRKIYRYTDKDVQPGQEYFYKIADVDFTGSLTMHGPVQIRIQKPQTYDLAQNYPNPFNPETTIEFSLAQPGRVELVIYNLLGQPVRTLVDRELEAGAHRAIWMADDDRGNPLPSGTYIYRLTVNDYRQTRKMTLLR